ncbi:MAG TPA: hypothetical protein P5081_03480 [Phycisphaerae bacterium]|nr:hypothetical protein [Phycisphaerae bacterium]
MRNRCFKWKRWTNAATWQGKVICFLCIFLMGAATMPMGGCEAAPAAFALRSFFDSATVFAIGTIIMSAIPEDARLAWVDDPAGFSWDFFGTRDAEGVPTGVDRVDATMGTQRVSFLFDGDGMVQRVESIDSDTGESAAAQVNYLPDRQAELSLYDAVTQDPSQPSATQTVTIPIDLDVPDLSGKLKHGGEARDDWRKVRIDAFEQMRRNGILRSELAARDGKRLASAAEANPTIDVKAQFRVSVVTEDGKPVTDARVAMDLSGIDRAPNIAATHVRDGIYQGEVTLIKAGDLAANIKQCENMLTIGAGVTGAILVVLAALSAGTGVAVGALITKLLGFAGGALTFAGAANYVKNQYENQGVCSFIVDYLAGQVDGNLKVVPRIVDHPTRKEIIGATAAATIVPVTPIATGAQTLWSLNPGIVVANEASGGLSDVSVSQRDIQFTLTDTGAEDGDEVTVEVRSVIAGTATVKEVFRGALKNAGETVNATLGPGPNTIKVTALNEGDLSPNTAGLEISHVVAGSASQSWNLLTDEEAVFTISAP